MNSVGVYQTDHERLLTKLGTTEDHLRGPSPMPNWTPTPPEKTVQIQLSWIDATKRYKIITITNTNYYKPDQWIMEEDLAKITAMKNWTYSVSSPDYLAMILGIAKNLPLPPIPIP